MFTTFNNRGLILAILFKNKILLAYPSVYFVVENNPPQISLSSLFVENVHPALIGQECDPFLGVKSFDHENPSLFAD